MTLYAKDSPLTKGLAAITGKMNAWGKGLMAIGAGIFGAGAGILGGLTAAVSQFTAMGSALDDIAQRTQLPVSMIAELGYAAEQSGASMETLEKALIAMQKNGLDPKDFDAIATSIAGIEDPVQRTQAALKAFGKSGAELLPMLEGVVQLRKEARDLGLVPTDDAVKKAAAIGDAFDRIRSQAMATIFEIGAALADWLLPALKAIQGIATAVIRWMRANQGVVRTVAVIGAALVGIGTVVAVIGAGFIAAGAVVAGISTVISTLGPILAAVLSPVGLIVLAIAAIAAGIALGVLYWLKFTASGKAAMQLIQAGLQPIIKAIQGIGDALMAGDIELASRIAATGMKLAFFSAIDAIVNKIVDIPKAIIDAMRPIAEFDPTGQLRKALAAADATLETVKFSTDPGATQKEMDDLLEQAKQARERAESEREQERQRRGYDWRDKVFGSFDANALTLQNWGSGGVGGKGKDDPQKRIEGYLQDMAKNLLPDLIMEVRQASPNWGE